MVVLQVLGDLILQQVKVELAKGTGVQSRGIVCWVTADEGDGLELVRDASEGGRGDTLDAQGLEEQEGLEWRVGDGERGHERVEGRDSRAQARL